MQGMQGMQGMIPTYARKMQSGVYIGLQMQICGGSRDNPRKHLHPLHSSTLPVGTGHTPSASVKLGRNGGIITNIGGST